LIENPELPQQDRGIAAMLRGATPAAFAAESIASLHAAIVVSVTLLNATMSLPPSVLELPVLDISFP
jgi:hypothetical protein